MMSSMPGAAPAVWRRLSHATVAWHIARLMRRSTGIQLAALWRALLRMRRLLHCRPGSVRSARLWRLAAER
jgi:hypothetical protein